MNIAKKGARAHGGSKYTYLYHLNQHITLRQSLCCARSAVIPEGPATLTKYIFLDPST